MSTAQDDARRAAAELFQRAYERRPPRAGAAQGIARLRALLN